MVKFFVISDKWSDGNLKERMEAENLPAVLIEKNANNGRIERKEYQCSDELALALLNAGARLEFSVWSPVLLETRRIWGCVNTNQKAHIIAENKIIGEGKI